MEFAVKGLLSRHQSLGVRQNLFFTSYTHPERDPGCLLRAHDFLRSFTGQFCHALVMFDREGCGQEKESRQDLELLVEGHLSGGGWADRCAAIVLDPELEIWVWSNSPEVDGILGWGGRQPSLRIWLERQGLMNPQSVKPDQPKDPKNALERALKFVGKPRSSAIYEQLAFKVGLKECVDPAFLKFKDKLHHWFPA